ncbi:unnamed protein product [Protopolystoma xenopodis]|uniref:Uncharacterized protein n=1 Tax=Protopolystoma xenopodis TaxID=117903 RepID=A0A3S4ZI57_9PLAT|nr:unnamed protein product [Protopolystoma xenopodis]
MEVVPERPKFTKTDCPKCRIEAGACHPKTKNIEIRRTCYRLLANGICQQLTSRRYKPCKSCSQSMNRRVGLCDYCRKSRRVEISIQFREEAGKYRCLTIQRQHMEPCRKF